MAKELTKIKKVKDPMGLCHDEDEVEARYPWGTELDFRDELVDEVGADKLEVGDEVHIVAKAFVRSTSEHKSEDEDGEETQKTVCIQLTDIGINKDDKATRTSALYGEGDSE